MIPETQRIKFCSVQMPMEMWQRLQAEAAKRAVSASYLIRRAVDDLLNTLEAPP